MSRDMDLNKQLDELQVVLDRLQKLLVNRETGLSAWWELLNNHLEYIRNWGPIPEVED